jgi:hypothetical protein
VKDEYKAYRDELIEHELSYYSQPRSSISIAYLLKGKCYSFGQKFVEKWPQLKLVCGFYGHNEHYWLVDLDGTIVDPTVWQFHEQGDDGDPRKYRVLDSSRDKVYIGRCMNCGNGIYGLLKDAPLSICPDIVENGVVEQSCQAELEAYYEREKKSVRPTSF